MSDRLSDMPLIAVLSSFRESVVSLEREELPVLRVCRDLEVCLELLERTDPRWVWSKIKEKTDFKASVVIGSLVPQPVFWYVLITYSSSSNTFMWACDKIIITSGFCEFSFIDLRGHRINLKAKIVINRSGKQKIYISTTHRLFCTNLPNLTIFVFFFEQLDNFAFNVSKNYSN